MPLYEYRCPACQGRFEVIQHLGTSAAETVCPTCGAQHVERQLSTFAVSGGGGGGAQAAPNESFGCGRPQCAGGMCAGGGDWN